MAVRLSDHFNLPRLLRFTFPSMVMMLFTSIYSVVDGLFVSNFVGENALAAINIIFPLSMIVSTLGFMLGTGGSAEVARIMGTGQPELAKQYFTTLIIATCVGSALLSGLCIVFIRPIAVRMGASELLLEDCVAYGTILLAGSVPLALQSSFQSFLMAAERPKLGLALSVAAGVTNMVLDYFFVARFGWGVAGAAVATVCGSLVGGIIPLIYFLLPNKSTLRLVKTRLYPKMLLKSCANGSSELMTNISASVVAVLYNLQLMRLVGEEGVAAWSAIMYIDFAFAAAFIGFSMGAAPIFSFQYGAGNKEELKSLYRKSLTVIGVLSLAMTIAPQLLAGPVTRLFVGYDPNLQDMMMGALRIFAVSYVVNGLNIFGSAFFTALGNGVVSALLSFLRTFAFRCGAVLILPVFFDLNGVWLAIPVAELLAACFTLFFLRHQKKRYGYG